MNLSLHAVVRSIGACLPGAGCRPVVLGVVGAATLLLAGCLDSPAPELVVLIDDLVNADGTSSLGAQPAGDAVRKPGPEADIQGDQTLTLYFKDCTTGDVLYTTSDTVPDFLLEFRFPGLDFQGTYCVGAELERQDTLWQTADMLTYGSGEPVFPDDHGTEIELTRGQVTDLHLVLYNAYDVDAEVVLQKDIRFTVEVTSEQKSYLESKQNMVAEATLAGCALVTQTLPLDFDAGAGTFSWADDDATFEVLANTPCTLSVDVKELDVTFMAGSVSFEATPYTHEQEIDAFPLFIVDAQLDITLEFQDDLVAFSADISSLTTYLTESTWYSDLQFLLDVGGDCPALQVNLDADSTLETLSGQFTCPGGGMAELTLSILDGTLPILEGSGLVDIPNQTALTIAMLYRYDLVLRSINLTNIYFRAYLSEQHDVRSGILVEVTDDNGMYKTCTTGVGNDTNDDVRDGDYTCMLRLPFPQGGSASYTATYSHPDCSTPEERQFEVDRIDSIALDYVEVCGSTCPPSLGALTVSPTSYDFPDRCGIVPGTIQFTNEGCQTLTYAIDEDAPWLSIPEGWEGTLEPGESATIPIEAKCLVSDTDTGTLTISSNDPDQPSIAVPVDLSCASGWVKNVWWGDPHLTTHDGLHYNIYAQGDFIAVMDSPGRFMIQMRAEFWNAAQTVSVGTGVAGLLTNEDDPGAEQIIFRYLAGQGLEILPAPSDPLPGADGGWVALDNGGYAGREGDAYFVDWPGCDSVKIVDRGGFINLYLHLTDGRSGTVDGVLGDYDGDYWNDLRDRDGNVYTPPVEPGILYNVILPTWVPASGENLFADELPYQPPGSGANPSQETLDWAAQVCRDAGVPETSAALFEDCTFDVAVTGDTTLAQGYAAMAYGFVEPAATMVSTCCTVCTTGKACGDSCIAADYSCHQPPGCACNYYEQ